MSDKEIIDFLNERLWSLHQTQTWPPKRLEFADNQGVQQAVSGSDIREMVKAAIEATAGPRQAPRQVPRP